MGDEADDHGRRHGGGATRTRLDRGHHEGDRATSPDGATSGKDGTDGDHDEGGRAATPPYEATGGTDGTDGDGDPKPLGQETPEVVEDASIIGQKRLDRPVAGDAMTGLIGGMAICFGAIAMVLAAAAVGGGLDHSSTGLLAGSLAYPIGFVILLVGKSELFTENFLLPVTSVLERRGTVRQLGALWTVSLATNLIGVLIFAALVSRGDVLAAEPAAEMIAVAEKIVAYDLTTTFIKGLFAGWLMTILTWLLLAGEGLGARLVIIWLIGFLLVIGQFSHVIISAAEIFTAMFLGADISVGTWLRVVFVPTLVGNVLGGVVFVTILQYIQASVEVPDGA